MDKDKISSSTVKRLSLYLDYLRGLYQQGTTTVSSQELAAHFLINPAQIRKDLSSFGQFGKRGEGYSVEALTWQIAEILGIDKPRKVILIGAGNLGAALLAYQGFEAQGFQLLAAIDADQRKIGTSISGIPCYAIDRLPALVKTEGIKMAILTTPSAAAQEITDQLVAAGIKAILNFSAVPLTVPTDVRVVSIDLASKLKTLSYFLGQG